MRSPVIQTLQAAIKNNHLLSWSLIDKIHFPKKIIDTQAIHMGHLNQERKNLQSTKEIATLHAILPFTA